MSILSLIEQAIPTVQYPPAVLDAQEESETLDFDVPDFSVLNLKDPVQFIFTSCTDIGNALIQSFVEVFSSLHTFTSTIIRLNHQHVCTFYFFSGISCLLCTYHLTVSPHIDNELASFLLKFNPKNIFCFSSLPYSSELPIFSTIAPSSTPSLSPISLPHNFFLSDLSAALMSLSRMYDTKVVVSIIRDSEVLLDLYQLASSELGHGLGLLFELISFNNGVGTVLELCLKKLATLRKPKAGYYS
ncbi:hypothetical protein RCL1_006584 [Eukaryota sp. TZLM3-RCL]